MKPRTCGTFATEDEAYACGYTYRQHFPTRAELARQVGPTCAANAPSIWPRAQEIQSDHAFALYAGMCLTDRSLQPCGPGLKVAGAFARGWMGWPPAKGGRGHAPDAEWSASESSVRRLVEWMKANGKLRIFPADGTPMEARFDDWAVFHVDDNAPALTAALRRAWDGSELEGFWALATAGGAA